LLSSFDLVSSPSTYISKRLKESSPGLPVVDMPHGIDKKLFDTCTEGSPYKNSPNAVFIGVNYLDWRFIGIVSAARPDVTFHIIGNPPGGISRPNVVCHGLIPFRETIRYLLNADIGLMSLVYRQGIEVFERTLKFIQYTYCRLPIVAPLYLGLEYPHLFAYKDAEESMISAFDQALQYDGDTIDRSWVRDWNEIAEHLIREGCGREKRGSA